MDVSRQYEQSLQAILALVRRHLAGGGTEEAHNILSQILSVEPDNPEARLLMGQVLLKRGDSNRAVTMLRKTVARTPSLAGLEILGSALLQTNRGQYVTEAFTCFRRALEMEPLSFISAFYLTMLGLRTDQQVMLLRFLPPILASERLEPEQRLILESGTAVAHYLTGDIAQAAEAAGRALALRSAAFTDEGLPRRGDPAHMYVFAKFIETLTRFHADHNHLYEGAHHTPLHVVGESHCLSSAHLTLPAYRVVPHLLMGAKAYFFSTQDGECWRDHLAQILRAIPANDPVVFCFGEIDCRPNEGIMEQLRRHPDFDLLGNVKDLVRSYIRHLRQSTRSRRGNVRVCGVPAPTREAAATYHLPENLQPAFLELIRHFNACLRAETEGQGLGFIDLYGLTVSPDGWAAPHLHIDDVHLKPSVVWQALVSII